MDVDEDEIALRPRTVDTAEYVRARVHQIAELLEVVDCSPQCATGNAGPRTVFQRLPRHMRRRAMSHNIKRLPRQLRPMALRNVSRTKHKKKVPSRLWRRRPSRLLKAKLREQRTSWLPTHIWHAKRFRMQKLWGYRLPIRCYQRGFRPNYRSSVNSADIIDQSYLCCMQIVMNGGNEQIGKLMSRFCRKNCSTTFSNTTALSGTIEMSTLLFSAKNDRFIGPARFSCSERTFQLWIHPSMENEFLNEIAAMDEIQIEYPKIYQKPETLTNPTNQMKLINLRNHFCRFQLIGPRALAHLHLALKLVSDKELKTLGHEEFSETHKWWNKNAAANILPGNLRGGIQICLLVEDPRLFRAQRRIEIEDSFTLKIETNSMDVPKMSSNLFWDWQKFHSELLPNRLSHKQFEDLIAGKLTFPRRTDFKIPILLVIRDNGQSSSMPANRVDFICHAPVGYDFWLSFQFAKNRPIGLHDKMSLDFECGMATFPDDCPDALAGKKQMEMEANALMEKYQRKPANRRVDFGRQLDGISPFEFEWAKILEENSTENFVVLRDKMHLKKMEIWLKCRNQFEKEVFFTSSNCLVPVSLKILSKGVPKRFAFIYLPTENELEQIRRKPERTLIKEDEKANKPIVDENLKEDEEKINEAEISGYLPLVGSNNSDSSYFPPIENISFNKLISLKDLFPDGEDKNQRKRARNRRERERRRRKKKKCLEDGEGKNLEGAMEIDDENGALEKAKSSRKVIGRVVRGDYSFIKAGGNAIGFVSFAALESIGKDAIVLLRNTTSKFGYPARLSIRQCQMEI